MKSNIINSIFNWRFFLKWGIPFLLILTIQIAQIYPLWIEQYYSIGWYVNISMFLRKITGLFLFSVGDMFYLLLGGYLILKLLMKIAQIIQKQFSWNKIVVVIFKLIRSLCWIYILFNILWGLNYSRLGIAHQLKLQPTEYCKEEVVALTNELIIKINECRRQLKDTQLPQPSLQQIFLESEHDYKSIGNNFSFLSFTSPSIKSSLFSSWGNYFGFTGYYNPFTGEAQVRNDVPRVLIPYISCHEMAHQLGYASESEANFVGYLSASSSNNIYFQYSVYLELFSYSQNEEIKMFLLDADVIGLKNVIQQNKNKLDSLVRKDRKEIRTFFYERENKIVPFMAAGYDQYLKLNKQLAGINSYNEVIGWLLSYQKKYGKL